LLFEQWSILWKSLPNLLINQASFRFFILYDIPIFVKAQYCVFTKNNFMKKFIKNFIKINV